jgi:hypothetical protein
MVKVWDLVRVWGLEMVKVWDLVRVWDLVKV